MEATCESRAHTAVATNEDEALDPPITEPAEPAQARDPVDESSKESFPASDPPSWWAGP